MDSETIEETWHRIWVSEFTESNGKESMAKVRARNLGLCRVKLHTGG